MSRSLTTRLSAIALALLAPAAITVAVAVVDRSDAQSPAPKTGVPLRGFTTHVVATHYLGKRAYRAEHYFKQLRPGLLQGIVFKDLTGGAPVAELEWAISTERYRALPAAQRSKWHPLGPAVDDGRVRVPGVSAADERAALDGIRELWAQTLNVAGIDGALPTGPSGVRSVTHLKPGEHRDR